MGRFEKFVKSRVWRWLPLPLFIILTVILRFTPAFFMVHSVLGDLAVLLMSGVAFLMGCLLGLIYRKLGLELALGSATFLLVCLISGLPPIFLAFIFYPPILIYIIALFLAVIAMMKQKSEAKENR